MNLTKEMWDQWRSDEVTKEWFKLFSERQIRNENLIPALIATGMEESIAQARVASGRHQELEDLLQTDYEDMK